MSVLFSPVGNSDPWRSGRDGAMLHIVRHFKPSKVVLFFTESLWEDDEKRQGHKHYDWEDIIQSVSPQSVVQIIVEPIKNAQDFDVYKEKFHKYIKSIEKEHPDTNILLNVTSGTPQMEATLCLEYIVYPENKSCIQVMTPEKGSNANLSHSQPETYTDMLKTVNLNEEGNEPRFKEIEIISFREAMMRSQILRLIDNYDYEAALSIITEQKSFRNKKMIINDLAQMTNDIKSHKVFKEINEKYTDRDLKKVLFHYLILKLRFDRGDFAEVLIRVKSIAEYIAEYYIKKTYPDIIKYREGKPILDIDNEGFECKYKLYLKNQGKKTDYIKDTLGLPAYVDILSMLDTNTSITKELRHVLNINGYRNSIAHRLEPISLNGKSERKKINNAVNAIKILTEEVFIDVDPNDFDFLEYKNNQIRENI